MSFKSEGKDSKDSYDSKHDDKGYKDDSFIAEEKEESRRHFRMVIKDVREKLEEELGPGSHSGEAVRKFFCDFDADGDGSVDKTEFRHAMRDIGIPVGDMEINAIYEKYATGNTLNYNDFLALLDFTSKATVKEITDDVRVAILEDLGPGAHCAARMKELFAKLDVDADGSITKDEFLRGMRRMNIPIGPKEVDILFKRFDEDDSGTIEYDEFIDMIGFQSRDEIMTILRDIREAVDDEVRSTSPAAFKRIFSSMDENGDGKIDKREFARAMEELRVPVGNHQIDQIFNVYDADNNGSFDYNEFLVLMEFSKHH